MKSEKSDLKSDQPLSGSHPALLQPAAERLGGESAVDLKSPLDDKLSGALFPSEQAGSPFEAIATPFESALLNYISSGHSALNAAVQHLPDSPITDVSDDFFNVSFEGLFDIPVREGREDLDYIEVLQHNTAGIEAVVRNTDFVAQLIADNVPNALMVTSVKQEIAPFVPLPSPLPEVTTQTVIAPPHVSPPVEYHQEGNFLAPFISSFPGFTLSLQAVSADSNIAVLFTFPAFVIDPATVFHLPLMAGMATNDLTASTDGNFTYVQGWASDQPYAEQHIYYRFSDGAGHDFFVDDNISVFVPPVVLDLNGDGVNLLSAQDSPMTWGQLTGTNSPLKVGWIGADDGMLMWNAYGDGQYHNLSQINFAGYVPGAKTDLQGLAAFDTDHNGVFNAQDKNFAQFGVLLSDGSYKSLAQLHITSLSLSSDNQASIQNGNIINGMTTFQYANGVQHVAADAALSIEKADVISTKHPLDHSLSSLSPSANAEPVPSHVSAAMNVQLNSAPETHPPAIPVIHESHGG